MSQTHSAVSEEVSIYDEYKFKNDYPLIETLKLYLF